MKIKDYIITARATHYTKNLFIFAGIIFAGKITNMDLLCKSILTFISFSLSSSGIYFINDWLDKDYDQFHPVKKNRPICKGKIQLPSVIITFFILIVLALTILFAFTNVVTGLIMILYIIINLLYSKWLKHIVLLDIFIISFGFILRVVIGSLAINVEISEWLLLSVFFLSLLLAASKRRYEYIKFNRDAEHAIRKVIVDYDKDFLNYLISILSGSTIISYSLYTILDDKYSNIFFTIPLVVYAIFRFLYIVFKNQTGGKLEKEIINDKHILTAVILWGILSIYFIHS